MRQALDPCIASDVLNKCTPKVGPLAAHPCHSCCPIHCRLLEVGDKGLQAHRDAVTALALGRHGGAQVRRSAQGGRLSAQPLGPTEM